MSTKVMQQKFALSLILLFTMAAALVANDGVYFTSGSFLVPVMETNISVTKEVLEITLCKDGYADVTVDYTFYNNTDDKTVTMAFEAAPPYNANTHFNPKGIHPYVKNFTVLFNGKKLQYRNAVVAEDGDFSPLNLMQWKGYGEVPDSLLPVDDVLYNAACDSFCSFSYAYYFDAPFKKGVNKVRHTYRYKMSYGIGREFEIPYSLTPATRWANLKIDDFTLRIKAEDTREIILNDTLFHNAPFKHSRNDETYQIQDDIYGECIFAELMKGDVVEWHSQDFSPKGIMCILSASTLRHGILEYAISGKVVIDKEGREFRYLTDSGSNYFVEAQDYGLVPKADARVEEREAEKGQGFVFLRNGIKKANVRQEPSKQSKVLFTVSNDGEIPEYYPCLGYTQDKSYNSWYKVNINGKTGYISAKLLLWDSIRL